MTKHLYVLRLLPMLVIGLFVVACGGGGGSVPRATTPVGGTSVASGGSAARAPATVTVKIPASRTPAYVSASTQQVTIAIAFASAPSVNITTQQFDVSASSSSCTSNSDGSRTCTLALQAPVGNDIFSVTGTDGAANVLEQVTVPAQVAQNAANTLNFSLNGVVASYGFAPTTVNVVPGTPARIDLYLEALDADQNIILGPASYASPITVTLSNDNGDGCNTMSFKASTLVTSTTITTPPSTSAPLTVPVYYLGAFFNASCPTTPSSGSVVVTPSGTGTQTGAATLVVSYAPASPSVTVGSYQTGAVAVAVSTPDPDSSGGEFTSQIDVYPAGVATPYAAAQSARTGAAVRRTAQGTYPYYALTYAGLQVGGLAFDPSGNLYAADTWKNLIAWWTPGQIASGNQSPTAIFTSNDFCSIAGVAADAFGDLYVSDDCGGYNLGYPESVARKPSAVRRTKARPASAIYGVPVVWVFSPVTWKAATNGTPAVPDWYLQDSSFQNGSLTGLGIDPSTNALYVAIAGDGSSTIAAYGYPASGIHAPAPSPSQTPDLLGSFSQNGTAASIAGAPATYLVVAGVDNSGYGYASGYTFSVIDGVAALNSNPLFALNASNAPVLTTASGTAVAAIDSASNVVVAVPGGSGNGSLAFFAPSIYQLGSKTGGPINPVAVIPALQGAPSAMAALPSGVTLSSQSARAGAALRKPVKP